MIPGLGRSPGERNGSPLQCSGLENSMDRGVWEAIVHGVTKSQTRLSDFTFTFSWTVEAREDIGNAGWANSWRLWGPVGELEVYP